MTERFKSILLSFIGFKTEFVISARYTFLSSSSALHATFPSEFPGHTKALQQRESEIYVEHLHKTVDKTLK